MSYNKIILKVLEERNDWIPSYELMCKSTKWGWLGPTSRRRCQELAEKGIIQTKHEGKYAYYKTKTPQAIHHQKQVRQPSHPDNKETSPQMSLMWS